MGDNKKLTYAQLKANVFYFLNTYKKVMNRYSSKNYDNRYFVPEEQRVKDFEIIVQTNQILDDITKSSHDYIMYEVLFPERGYQYSRRCSRATTYRIRKKAIMEVAECLHLTDKSS